MFSFYHQVYLGRFLPCNSHDRLLTGKLDMAGCLWKISQLLLLCSNDVESNPGPLAPLSRGPNLEKAVTDLKRELKEMSRVLERQDQQISNLKRAADRFNLEEEVMTIK